MSRAARQADVARMAGVSQATVSLVLNGDSSRVGAETRRRVVDAIERVGYQANPMAQRLAGGRNGIIGVFAYEPVFPRASGDFYYPFLEGIEAAAERQGCDVLLITSAPVEDGRRRLSQKIRAHLAITDGCILLGRNEDKEELADVMGSGIPLVFIGRRTLPGQIDLPYVAADYGAATGKVVADLVERGHSRIAFFGEISARESVVDRIAGYRTAMRAAGLRPASHDAAEVSPAELLTLVHEHAITALVVGDSHRADALRRAASERGVTIPADLSIAVLGQPEKPISEEVSWSGFTLRREQMGAAAVSLLAELIKDGSDVARHRIVDCTIEPGETIAAPRAESR